MKSVLILLCELYHVGLNICCIAVYIAALPRLINARCIRRFTSPDGHHRSCQGSHGLVGIFQYSVNQTRDSKTYECLQVLTGAIFSQITLTVICKCGMWFIATYVANSYSSYIIVCVLYGTFVLTSQGCYRMTDTHARLLITGVRSSSIICIQNGSLHFSV